MAFAEACCHAAQTLGITSLNVIEHNVSPKEARFRSISFHSLKVGGEAQPFRYDISPKAKVSVMCPKALGDKVDLMALRPTVIGGLFVDNLTAVPQSSMASVLWEAAQLSSRILKIS